jgi:hypothetical protein
MKIRHVVGYARACGLLFECVERPEIRTKIVDWAQLSMFQLKTETEFSLLNIMF